MATAAPDVVISTITRMGESGSGVKNGAYGGNQLTFSYQMLPLEIKTICHIQDMPMLVKWDIICYTIYIACSFEVDTCGGLCN